MTECLGQDPNGAMCKQAPRDSGRLRLVCLAVSLVALIVLGVAAWWLLASLKPEVLGTLVERHGPALIGVPAAVCLATAVTCAARAIDGKVGFDFLGVRAQGATATGGLWLTVFLAVALSVKWLW